MILNLFILLFLSLFAQARDRKHLGKRLGKCQTTRIRREIRDLSDSTRKKYFKAFNELSRNLVVSSFVKMHSKEYGAFNLTHMSPLLLPYHRAFIRDFEDKISARMDDPTFGLPYWDWTMDSQNPTQSIIFSAEFMGEADPKTGFIINGAFSQSNYRVLNIPGEPDNVQTNGIFYSLFNIKGIPLVRNYARPGAKEVVLAHKTIMDKVMNVDSSFSEMTKKLEPKLHDTVHSGIGSRGGHLTTWKSPYDPIFYLHHSFIDKIWWKWQKKNKNMMKFDTKAFQNWNNFDSSYPIPQYDVPVSHVLDNFDLCVEYAEPGDVAKKEATDDPKLTKIKPPKLSKTELLGMGISSKDADKMINELKEDVDMINHDIFHHTEIVIPKHTSTTTVSSTETPIQHINKDDDKKSLPKNPPPKDDKNSSIHYTFSIPILLGCIILIF